MLSPTHFLSTHRWSPKTPCPVEKTSRSETGIKVSIRL
ncbi:hypothetical protein CEXT_492611, partial [Caerostris extrusa]